MLHIKSSVPENSHNTDVSDTIKLSRTPTPPDDPADPPTCGKLDDALGAFVLAVAPVPVAPGTATVFAYVRT